MADKKLYVGIAGYGVVGKRRRLFIDQNPHFKTVAVSDINFGGEGITEDGIRYFSDFNSLLSQDMDVLFVSLPNYLAAEATIAGLKRGIHVFCEKPPGRTVQDIREVMAAEKEQPHLKLKYGFNHRYHESVKEAKKVIESGQYGEIINLKGVYGKSGIILFDTSWRSERQYAGGGILLDQGIHMLDMMLYFAGNFEEVKSFISNDYWHHDVEDNAYAIMRSSNGCVAMLHSTATQWQHKFRLEITLKEALLELTGILSGTKSYGDERMKIIPKKGDSSVGSLLEINNSYLDDNSWQSEIDEFADIIINNKPVVNGNSHDALNVMELVYRIYCADSRWQEALNIQHP
jgi:predicted dehydrogenase